MRKVSIFKNNRNQAIRLPKEFQFEGVSELEISRQGDTVMLRPIKPSWLSFASDSLADEDFLAERPTVVEDGDFSL